MAKRNKKRNKVYRGEDASVPVKETVHRYKAVVRSPLGEWWQSRKKLIKRLTIALVIIVVVVWLIIEAIAALSRA